VSEDQSWLRFEFYPEGTELISQGGKSGSLIVLKEGELEVLRDGHFVSSSSLPGAIFGEMSVLLERPHSATVRAVSEVQVFVIDNALAVLERHPSWLLQIARLLAQRVNLTTARLVATRKADDEDRDILVLPQNFISSWGDPQV
jgi:CRP/FNR family transcriptional regulator, cyclic AMP receptor protein